MREETASQAGPGDAAGVGLAADCSDRGGCGFLAEGMGCRVFSTHWALFSGQADDRAFQVVSGKGKVDWEALKRQVIYDDHKSKENKRKDD